MPFTVLSRYQQALARRSQHWSPTTRGLLWTSAAGFIFSMLNALMRLLTQQIDPFQAQFLRYAFGLLVILPLVWRWHTRWGCACGSPRCRRSRWPT